MRGQVQLSRPPTLGPGEPFRLLFAGQSLSVVGDRMMAVAIAFAVLSIGDATDLGIVLAASGIPFALFAIAGGVLSDRVGRRRTMIASDVARAACLLALRPGSVAAGAEPEDDGFAARLHAGWREVRARPWLTVGLGAMAAYHVFVLPGVYVLGPAMSQRELSGASSWATIVACWGIGTAVGNLLAMRIRLERPVLAAAVALVGACTQAVIIGSGLGTAGIAALELLAGIASSLFFTLWDTSIQEQVPPHAGGGGRGAPGGAGPAGRRRAARGGGGDGEPPAGPRRARYSATGPSTP